MKTKKDKVISSTYLVINFKTKLCKCSKIANTSCRQKMPGQTADSDKTASSEAVWSGSSPFAIVMSIL